VLGNTLSHTGQLVSIRNTSLALRVPIPLVEVVDRLPSLGKLFHFDDALVRAVVFVRYARMIAHNTPKAGDDPSRRHGQLFQHSKELFEKMAVGKLFLQR
jgi:hypothetical protein